MIKVLLVDDHELVRTGIRRLLEDADGIKVVAEAGTGEAAIDVVRQRRPDVVLMDLSMPGIGGLEATRRIQQIAPTLPVVIVTVHTDDPFPLRLMQAGARGYLSKGCTVEEMVHALREVHEGRRYISPAIAQNVALAVLEAEEGRERSPLSALSQRELQVLYMLVRGDKVQAISDQLNLSPKTVSTYRYRLFSKLGVRNDAGLALLAMRYGLLEGSTA